MAEFGNNNVDLDIWVLFHILKDNLALFEALGFPNSGLNLRWEDVVIFIFIKLLLMDISLRWKGSHKSIKRLYSMDTSAWGRGHIFLQLFQKRRDTVIFSRNNSSDTPSVQGGTGVLRPNGQKKIRIFAAEGQFSDQDRAELSFYADNSQLNIKSHVRENQNVLKDILKPFHPTETVVLQFLLDAAREPPNLKLAHPCDSCGKAFAYREALISHKKKKHNTLVPQVFQCKYCDYKGAKTLKAHRDHERRHARPAVKNAPQHQCESCEKRF